MNSFVCFLLVLLAYVAVEAEYVTRKFCKDVDAAQCTIRNIIVDPCAQTAQGPAFCVLKKNKSYAVTMDMTPHFAASKLKLSMSADVDNSGDFSTTLKSPGDACTLLYCPLQANERRIFDINLQVDKRATGKFPVMVKMWNEEDPSQACCATFNVKVK